MPSRKFLNFNSILIDDSLEDLFEGRIWLERAIEALEIKGGKAPVVKPAYCELKV